MIMPDKEPMTPMMVQYHQIKEQHKDAVLFFRLGDFYEMFEEDAIEVSRLLNLTLTKRNSIPMCGIPFHASKVYIKRLLDAGKKIAICEQTELAQAGKQIAKREVVQVVTPATVVEDDYLVATNNCYVLSIALLKDGISLSYADISSAQFFLEFVEKDIRFASLLSVLEQVKPREILVNEDDYFLLKEYQQLIDDHGAMVTKLPNWRFSIVDGHALIAEHLGMQSLAAFNLTEQDVRLASAGALLWYLRETAKTSLNQIDSLVVVDQNKFLQIDEASRKSLELLGNLADGSQSYTLFKAIDSTVTSMGARKLKHWITCILTDVDQILQRQSWVSKFYDDRDEMSRVRSCLKEVLDIQRLVSRISMARHQSRDLVGLAQSVEAFFQLMDQQYQTLLGSNISQKQLEQLLDLTNTIKRAVNSDHNGPFEEGKVINTGYDPELDALRNSKEGGKHLLASYLQQVRNQTGITTLKLSSNKILGHYLEVSKAQADKMPHTFYRKQTLVNAERFTSDELLSHEKTIYKSTQLSEIREKQVYENIVEQTKSLLQPLLTISEFLSDLDCLCSLAYTAIKHNYTKPTFVGEDSLYLEEGRHPVVEQHMSIGQFVANDLSISSMGKRFCLITGPNMAGKSTFLRQTALIVLMAQMGSFVPAKEARLSIVDRLYCRVGASDNLARGESTFLVEMQEAAHILRTSTRHSLVIVDELGRGTSTQDGMSIAYAVMQRLMEIGAKTLFATHYHELARIDTSLIQLLTLQVQETSGQIRFLRRVIEGIANSSYGLQVAKMAGVGRDVLKQARHFQKQHFAEYDLQAMQPDLFSTVAQEFSDVFTVPEAEEEVIQELLSFSIEHSSPLEALLLIKKLQQKLQAK